MLAVFYTCIIIYGSRSIALQYSLPWLSLSWSCHAQVKECTHHYFPHPGLSYRRHLHRLYRWISRHLLPLTGPRIVVRIPLLPVQQ